MERLGIGVDRNNNLYLSLIHIWQRADILQGIRNEYEEAARRERLLLTDYQHQTGVVTDQGEKAIQYNILKREVDTNRQIYDLSLIHI